MFVQNNSINMSIKNKMPPMAIFFYILFFISSLQSIILITTSLLSLVTVGTLPDGTSGFSFLTNIIGAILLITAFIGFNYRLFWTVYLIVGLVVTDIIAFVVHYFETRISHSTPIEVSALPLTLGIDFLLLMSFLRLSKSYLIERKAKETSLHPPIVATTLSRVFILQAIISVIVAIIYLFVVKEPDYVLPILLLVIHAMAALLSVVTKRNRSFLNFGWLVNALSIITMILVVKGGEAAAIVIIIPFLVLWGAMIFEVFYTLYLAGWLLFFKRKSELN